ncbi:MAG TPA: DUF2177 family protein [Afipia sp.]
MKRYIILYLTTLIILLPIDFMFLGTLAKDFFQAQVGEMLGPVRMAPAVIFYLLYVAGIVIFVSAGTSEWQTALIYGALFGLFCYATFELTSLALLKHWTWPVVVLDISWGMFVTGTAAALGLLLTNWIMTKV